MAHAGTPKRKRRSSAWRPRFLAALAATATVRGACEAAGVPRRTAYHHRRRELGVAAAWDLALDEAADAIEAEARRRAVDGVDRPVFYRGHQVGSVREYSDLLLIVLLKALRPHKFREGHCVRHAGGGVAGDGVPVVVRAQAAAEG